jgi:hypothetical protein
MTTNDTREDLDVAVRDEPERDRASAMEEVPDDPFPRAVDASKPTTPIRVRA